MDRCGTLSVNFWFLVFSFPAAPFAVACSSSPFHITSLRPFLSSPFIHLTLPQQPSSGEQQQTLWPSIRPAGASPSLSSSASCHLSLDSISTWRGLSKSASLRSCPRRLWSLVRESSPGAGACVLSRDLYQRAGIKWSQLDIIKGHANTNNSHHEMSMSLSYSFPTCSFSYTRYPPHVHPDLADQRFLFR